MKLHPVIAGLIAVAIASGAVAQTTSPANGSTPSSSMPSNSMPSNSSTPSNTDPSSSSRMPHNGGADQSSAAKEQQSQKQPCKGNDHSNVNCKQKTGNNPNDTSTNPK